MAWAVLGEGGTFLGFVETFWIGLHAFVMVTYIYFRST